MSMISLNFRVTSTSCGARDKGCSRWSHDDRHPKDDDTNHDGDGAHLLPILAESSYM
jgi:hypothetical protein